MSNTDAKEGRIIATPEQVRFVAERFAENEWPTTWDSQDVARIAAFLWAAITEYNTRLSKPASGLFIQDEEARHEGTDEATTADGGSGDREHSIRSRSRMRGEVHSDGGGDVGGMDEEEL
jgi:hypothetical protein